MECAKRGFAHPRKRLASNLELKGEAAKVLEEVGLDPDVRAEDVSLEQWAALARALNK
jgi:16S rRNA A1518/A1519 N6-dimethyltransferase RsmA/KsgA/DIM1 with predicted DNA glycosylase/AP lyase activity